MLLTSWGGAQYIDWWSLVHLLGGLAMAYALRLVGFDMVDALLVVGAVLIGWEIYEWAAKIREPWTNSIVDLILGFLGIVLAFKISPVIEPTMQTILAVLMLVVWVALNLWGWVSWRHRQS